VMRPPPISTLRNVGGELGTPAPSRTVPGDGAVGVAEAVCVAVVITPVDVPPSETGFAPTGEETTGLGALGAAHG